MTASRRIAMLLSNAFRPDPRVLKEANSLQKAGFSVTILCWDRAAELAQLETLESGVEVIRIQNVPSAYGIGKGQLLRLPRFWRETIGLLNQIQPDLVHCHDFDTLPAGLAWGRRHSAAIVYDAHEYYADLCQPRLTGLSGTLLYHLIRIGELAGSRLASAVVTVDDTLGNIYRRHNQDVVIIGHYPAIEFASNPAPVFRRNEIHLIYAGRLSADRGTTKYVEILRCLIQLGLPARLTLAGVFTPASEEETLRKQSLDVADRISLAGWIPYSQMPALLETADIGLAILQPEPRYAAALPVKMFEYMACGLPVVASNFPPIQAIYEQCHFGVLVDPQAPVETIANLIAGWWKSPETARQLGANGRSAVLERYNWETLMEQLKRLYQRLLD